MNVPDALFYGIELKQDCWTLGYKSLKVLWKGFGSIQNINNQN